jgi:hypothetical protein
MVKRALVVAAALTLLAVGLATAFLQGTGEGRAPKARASKPAGSKTYQQLVAANYKVLRPRQTRRLLRFADAFQACMVAHVQLGEPKALATRIVMAVPGGAAPSVVLRFTGRCGAKLGDPPPGSSLLLRRHAIVLFLPKRCLLDPKVVRGKS